MIASLAFEPLRGSKRWLLLLLQVGGEDPELVMTIVAAHFANGGGDRGYRRRWDGLGLLLPMLLLLVQLAVDLMIR